MTPLKEVIFQEKWFPVRLKTVSELSCPFTLRLMPQSEWKRPWLIILSLSDEGLLKSFFFMLAARNIDQVINLLCIDSILSQCNSTRLMIPLHLFTSSSLFLIYFHPSPSLLFTSSFFLHIPPFIDVGCLVGTFSKILCLIAYIE